MELEHLIQKNLGSGRCICIISGWEEVGLLAESVYHYHHSCISSGCAREMGEEVPADRLPVAFWNIKGVEESIGLGLVGLVLLACAVSGNIFCNYFVHS